ncbi:hypothetical protein GGF46_002522, partial [Coemansia sp. RSA 552]
MVLQPIKRAVVPSPLTDALGFDDFLTQYLNKCDDLLSYTQRYPVVKEAGSITLQRQNRNPHEDHRWLRRNVRISGVAYDELKSVLFRDRTEHLARWVPQMIKTENVESIVPNLCEVQHLEFRSPGLKSRRDYCQLVIKREFIGSAAKPKPRLFTPSASMANLAQVYRSQSSTNLQAVDLSPVSLPPPLSPAPGSPTLPGTGYFDAVRTARSVVDLHDASIRDPSPYGMVRSGSTVREVAPPLPHLPPPPPQQQQQPKQQQQQQQYVGLSPEDSIRPSDDESTVDSAKPLRRFQIVTVPMSHRECPSQKGYVRAYYESYEEIREYGDGQLEWVCIYHSDFSGWVPSFMADKSIANSFPKEANALLDYV